MFASWMSSHRRVQYCPTGARHTGSYCHGIGLRQPCGRKLEVVRFGLYEMTSDIAGVVQCYPIRQSTLLPYSWQSLGHQNMVEGTPLLETFRPCVLSEDDIWMY